MKLTKKIVIAVISIILSGIAGNLYIISGLGGDPIIAYSTGLNNVWELGIGLYMIMLHMLCAIILLFINRKKVGIGTIIAMFGVGPAIEICGKIYSPELSSPILRYVVLIIGIIIFSFSIALYILNNIGGTSIEELAIEITTRTKIPVQFTRGTMDVIFVTVGFIFGGAVGIGTLIIVCLFSPLFAVWLKCLKKIKILGE